MGTTQTALLINKRCTMHTPVTWVTQVGSHDPPFGGLIHLGKRAIFGGSARYQRRLAVNFDTAQDRAESELSKTATLSAIPLKAPHVVEKTPTPV